MLKYRYADIGFFGFKGVSSVSGVPKTTLLLPNSGVAWFLDSSLAKDMRSYVGLVGLTSFV